MEFFCIYSESVWTMHITFTDQKKKIYIYMYIMKAALGKKKKQKPIISHQYI